MSRPPPGSQEQSIPSYRPRGQPFRPRPPYNDGGFNAPPPNQQGNWNFPPPGPRGPPPPLGYQPQQANFGGQFQRADYSGMHRGAPVRRFQSNANVGGRMPPRAPFGRMEMQTPDFRPPYGPPNTSVPPPMMPMRPYVRGGAPAVVIPMAGRGRGGKRTGVARQVDEEDVLTVRPLWVLDWLPDWPDSNCSSCCNPLPIQTFDRSIDRLLDWLIDYCLKNWFQVIYE